MYQNASRNDDLVKSFSQIEVDTSNGIFKKKNHYNASDLIDFYENMRFTIPFVVYRMMDKWPILDFFAAYCGHLINNLIIVIVAINYSVSILMCFNVFCVCYLYMRATIELNKKSLQNFRETGIQSQCDLKMVQIISRRFQHEAF